MYYTTKLSPSVFRPVSLRYTTMRGHTPMMLLTTSTRDGIDSSPVMMARRRLVRDIIQSRCSAPFSRLTRNSVTTGSPERLYTKTQHPHEVIFILESARSKTSPNRIHCLASKEILNSKANGSR